MTRSAHAVIGAGYGDEGKGLMTDWLAWKHSADVVVRTNGGAQAGHTVVAPDGTRHVFSHLGSGAYAGAATHLARHFVLHPMFFLGEVEAVVASGGRTDVSADPRCLVTTPYDIMINQIVERARGLARHGSCGMGFGETIERNLDPEFSIAFADLGGSRLSLVSRLERIRREWIGPRLARLGVDAIPEDFVDLVRGDAVLRRFLDDCDAFFASVSTRNDGDLTGPLVIEGAQGLMLDQDYGTMPFCTRSNTGILNMSEFAREAGIETIDAVYVTRCYKTRHGAGPIAHADADMSFVDIVDPTNRPNDWQGSIRSAPLDLDVLSGAISHDLRQAGGVHVDATLAVTCLDQAKTDVAFSSGGTFQRVPSGFLAARAAEACGIALGPVSFGPSRSDVVAPR